MDCYFFLFGWSIARQKHDCIGAFVNAFECFCFLKFGSELTSRYFIHGPACASFLFPASVVVNLELHVLIEFRGSSFIFFGIVAVCDFSHGHNCGPEIGFFSIKFGRGKHFAFDHCVNWLYCVLWLWLMIFFVKAMFVGRMKIILKLLDWCWWPLLWTLMMLLNSFRLEHC